MSKKTYTKNDALAAWEGQDKKGAFDLVEVETVEGEQTQILDKATGSLVIAVDGTGADAYRKLAENPRAPLIDRGESPKEQVEGDEPRYTSAGVIATPTQPESLENPSEPVEIDNSKPRQTVKR